MFRILSWGNWVISCSKSGKTFYEDLTDRRQHTWLLGEKCRKPEYKVALRRKWSYLRGKLKRQSMDGRIIKSRREVDRNLIKM